MHALARERGIFVGALVIGAALFLGAGLAIRHRIWRGIAVPSARAQSSPKSVMGHRVF